MHWFSGSIPEAIQKAKRQKALFVVAVHGGDDDEASQRFLSLLDSEAVAGSRLSSAEAVVAIRLTAGSQACDQFSQIYPVLVVPALYLIDSQTGRDLEVIPCLGDDFTADKMLDVFNRVMDHQQQQQQQPGPLPTPHLSAVAAADPGAAAAPSPRAARVEEAQQLLQQAGADAGASSSAANALSPAPASLEDRVQRAKDLLAERRQQKEMSEQEGETSSEKKRREMGQQMQEWKRQQEDEATRKAALERKREKEEERAARERVRAQIAQDRADRARKFEQQKEEADKQRDEKERMRTEQKREEEEQARIERSTIGRIQFRLPDGRSQTRQFDALDTLSSIYAFVESDLDLPFADFSLSTTFPTRQLDREDRSATLRQLALVPSATLLVLPRQDSSASALIGRHGDFTSLVWLLFTPITFLWGLLSSFFAGSGASASAPPADPAGQSAEGQARSSSTAAAAAARRHQGSSGIKKEGNMARLSNDDDDDENNTWNGNSTQQM